MENSIKEYLDKVKENFNNVDLPANIVSIVVVGALLLWIILGFSGNIMIIVLFITNIVCLFFLYDKNPLSINI